MDKVIINSYEDFEKLVGQEIGDSRGYRTCEGGKSLS